MEQEIDAALAANPKLELLGMFSSDDVEIESICIRIHLTFRLLRRDLPGA